MHVPLTRRLQTAAVLMWALLIPVCTSLFFFLCSIPALWPLIIMYCIWAFGFDTSPRTGGRPSQKFRDLPLWRYFAGYYPQKLVKTQDLPPDRPYVFGYHPHGIIGMGAFATFATEGTGFSKAFPGIKPHLLTLTNNFHIPIYRDILLFLGVCSVSKKSCSNILRRGPGSSITIVVGGATESLSAHPGTADLTLKKRLGFIKLAIVHGADLVPVFAFGENDVLKNEKGTTVHAVQAKFQALFGFTLPLFHGRGLFTYNFGLMPFRHPIVSVIGRPIQVKQNPDPTKEEVEMYQKQYIDELMHVWNTYKDVYAKERVRCVTLPT
ncbi:diacylglycerol acyltransferase [Clavulina sp. PMI_390]|nr:diacylglycerol acyltransferase [Clavulina sp. PMI_390]